MNNHERKWTVKSMPSIKLLVTLLTSLFLFGCKKQMDEIEEELMGKDKDKVQLFITNLHSVNNSGVTGRVIFKYREGGKFLVHVDAKGLVAGKEHPQHIHLKAECPPASAAGEDGLLSLPEGLPFYGPILVPLDDDLVPLTSEEFPVANKRGMISYFQFTALRSLTSAIEQMFPMKMELNLEKRSYVIHGAFVKNGEIVPPGTEGAEYIATLPVGCGEIKPVHDHNNGDGDEFNQ